jgi:hypothetical protein
MNKTTVDNQIDKILKEQTRVCAEVEKSLKVNGVVAINKLLNKNKNTKTILR